FFLLFSNAWPRSPDVIENGVSMMKTISIRVLLLALVATVPAYAHHSFAAEFDANKPVKITGAVTKVEWQNPHVWFYIDVKDASSGKIANWGIEMGSP